MTAQVFANRALKRIDDLFAPPFQYGQHQCYTLVTVGQPTTAPTKYRFGSFELDRNTGELRKRGIKLNLQTQPYRVLCLLLDNPGEVIPRDTLCNTLWPEDTFVEFERSLNAAIAKLRRILSDSAENPRFVETVARHGYRFIAPVQIEAPANASRSPESAEDNPAGAAPAPISHQGRFAASIATAIVLLLAIVATLVIQTRRSLPEHYTVMRRITSDRGLTRDPTVSPDGAMLAYASDREGRGNLNIWVQQLSGGAAVRLTNFEADDHQPSFSPDGTQIVFRSERAGGGVYVVPTLGGESRLIAQDGRDPSFSPDGKWIVYWTGNVTYDSLNAGSVFVIPSRGGAPERLNSDIEVGMPVWAPDSTHLLVVKRAPDYVWSIISRTGRTDVDTGALQRLRQQGFALDINAGNLPRVTQWIGSELIFSARFHDSVNVWSIPISTRSWRIEGAARRLTSGADIEDSAYLLRDRRLVFAGLSRSANLWSLDLGWHGGRPLASGLRRLTDKTSLEQFASISNDGKYVVFSSTRSGTPQVLCRNLSSGEETPVGRSDELQEHPEISHDGSLIAYSNDDGEVVVPRSSPALVESVCHQCGWVWDWSPDNQRFLYNDLAPAWGIRSFDIKSAKQVQVLSSRNGLLYQARFSPDGKWIVFGQQIRYSTSRLFIAPLHNGVAGPETEWIPIADETGWCDKPRWSPDGKLIYFISHRDGYGCLWAQLISPQTRRPAGPPFNIAHFHSARLSMMNVGTGLLELGVAKDKIVFNLGEVTGNIWAASTK